MAPCPFLMAPVLCHYFETFVDQGSFFFFTCWEWQLIQGLFFQSWQFVWIGGGWGGRVKCWLQNLKCWVIDVDSGWLKLFFAHILMEARSWDLVMPLTMDLNDSNYYVEGFGMGKRSPSDYFLCSFVNCYLVFIYYSNFYHRIAVSRNTEWWVNIASWFRDIS